MAPKSKKTSGAIADPSQNPIFSEDSSDDRSSVQEDTPLVFKQPDVRNSLVPYLALGFMAVPVSGDGEDKLADKEESSLKALLLSLRAAILALEMPIPSEKFKELSLERMKIWYHSDKYMDELRKVTDRVKDPKARELGLKRWSPEPGKEFTNVDMMLLLQVANDELGSHFRLGIIVKGSRTSASPNPNGDVDEVVKPTVAELVPNPPVKDLDIRPALFIVDNKGKRNSTGKRNSMDRVSPVFGSKEVLV